MCRCATRANGASSSADFYAYDDETRAGRYASAGVQASRRSSVQSRYSVHSIGLPPGLDLGRDGRESAEDAEEPPCFFDPEGMPDIRRLSRRLSASIRNAGGDGDSIRMVPVNWQLSYSSGMSGVPATVMDADELTLTEVQIGDGPFDFEKFLRGLVRK